MYILIDYNQFIYTVNTGLPIVSTIDDMATPPSSSVPVRTVPNSSPSASNSGLSSISTIDDMASPPSSSVGGYPSYLLTLFGAVLVLLFVIIILILVLILVVMVTSKRKKKTYPIEARNPSNDKMELELSKCLSSCIYVFVYRALSWYYPLHVIFALVAFIKSTPIWPPLYALNRVQYSTIITRPYSLYVTH